MSNTARDERSLHPQGQWEWPIAVYLYLAGLGAGAYAVGVVVSWLAAPEVRSPVLLLWGPVLVALGAPFLVLDLGKKTRFMRASLNPGSSWAARGFVILTSLIVVGLVSFGVALLRDAGFSFPGQVPGFVLGQPFTTAVNIVALVLSFGTVAYTGVFLKSVRYVSLWNTWLLPVLFSISALSTGAAALIVFLLGAGLAVHDVNLVALTHILIPVQVLLLSLEVLALASLLLVLRRGRRIEDHVLRHLAVKSSPGLLLPVIAAISAWSMPSDARTVGSGPYSLLVGVAATLVLVGGFLLRYDVVKLGAKDRHPLQGMIDAQYNWRALAPFAGGQREGTDNG